MSSHHFGLQVHFAEGEKHAADDGGGVQASLREHAKPGET